MSAPIRLLVVDDHTLFRRGLTALLSRDPSLYVVGDAADASQAQRRAQELQPDVILLDNHLPGVHGIDALPALHAAAPHARILMLTVSEDSDDLVAALRAGACGYLLKTIEGDDLTRAIHRAMQGEHIIAPEMTTKLVTALRDTSAPAPVAPPATSATATETTAITSVALTPPPALATPASPTTPWSSLSPRELDILRGIAQGASNKEIARDLSIAETTVKIHVQHILRKLGMSSRVQVAVFAAEHGLANPM